MNGQDVLDRARPVLFDADGVRWGNAELLNYAADAQQLIAKYVPESVTRTMTIDLAAGDTKQSLPAGYARLIRLIRNMGADGATTGGSITPTTRESMNACRPDWHTETGRQVYHYIYDPLSEPRTFYVYPAPKSATKVLAELEPNMPTTIGAGTQFNVSGAWINAVLDWVLYRAFSKDADHGGNLARASSYGQNFAQAIGMEFKTRNEGNIKREVRPNNG